MNGMDDFEESDFDRKEWIRTIESGCKTVQEN